MDAIDRRILSIGQGAEALPTVSLGQMITMLGAHGRAVRDARADQLMIRGPVWQSVETISRHLQTCFCPLVLDRFDRLLPTSDLTFARRGADEASLIDYAEAVAAVSAWEMAVGKHALLRAEIRKRLLSVSTACLARIDAHLSIADEADIPDFRQLAREILRAEVAEWVFSLAGAPEHSTKILQRASRAARQSVAWAGRVFERFRAEPDEFSHFDAVATLAAVDELLVVILRVHDSDRMERASGSHPFVLTIGEQALQEFVTGLEHMTARYLEIAEDHLLAGGAAGAFVLSVLQVLQRIVRLDHVLLPVVSTLGVKLSHQATVLRMQEMQGRLQASLGTHNAPPDAMKRLGILDTALASFEK
ncbi:hypothetical protein [Thalassobaculum sp.]|uniref:hypothetical protein n=1 Tax=Thalassobaculum sp. TaxID=2022740 RepID=UPI0032EB5288